MKLKLKFKKIFTANIMLVVSTCLFAQTNVENFDYPVSTLLTDASIGFEIKASIPSISVVSPGLEYSGLAVSGIGNAAHINISEDGDTDPNTYGPERIAKKPFFSSSVNSGTVYLSFLGEHYNHNWWRLQQFLYCCKRFHISGEFTWKSDGKR